MPVAEIANRMLDTYPRDFNVRQDVLVRCIDASADSRSDYDADMSRALLEACPAACRELLAAFA